jgi:hypothetical protein
MLRRIPKGAVALLLAIPAFGAGMAVTAAASTSHTTSTTFYACLSNGSLSKVSMSAHKCSVGKAVHWSAGNIAAGQSCPMGQSVTGFAASGSIVCGNQIPSLVASTTQYGCGGTCWGSIAGVGLKPGAAITFYATTPINGSFATGAIPASGVLSDDHIELSCGSDWTGVYATTTTAGGAPITSNVVNTPCG